MRVCSTAVIHANVTAITIPSASLLSPLELYTLRAMIGVWNAPQVKVKANLGAVILL